MTGLKSGSGDDLWDDDDDESAADDAADGGNSAADPETTEDAADSDARTTAASGGAPETETQTHPYIVRRAIRDKSVQFERDERLTFFVHDDVVEGERDLLTELESALGRDVPKFDVREAVYRAALRNPDDVLDELLDMGYSLDEERE